MQGYEQDSERFEYEEEATRINALSLKWALGLNFNMIDGIHNLTNDHRREIFYAVGHTGVIYDYENNGQRLLQGHCNKITCVGYNLREDIIVSADLGPDSMLVVWDAKTGIPRKTILDPHPFGTQALDISENGQFIVTLSRTKEKDQLQTISLWQWQADTPGLVQCDIEDLSLDSTNTVPTYYNYVKFNPDNPNEFVITGSDKIQFWTYSNNNEAGLESYLPKALSSSSTKRYTQTVFIPKSTQVVSGTEDGYIVVWDITIIMENYNQPEQRRAIKNVNLMNTNKKTEGGKKIQAAINIVKVEGPFLVIGSSNGSIRFYDFQYRIIAWFEDIDIRSITNISFANHNLQDNEIWQEYYSKEDSEFTEAEKEKLQNRPFLCQDFIVVDDEAKITQLNYGLFDMIDKDKKKGSILIRSIISPIVSISVRPNSNTLAISCENGFLYQWDFQTKPQEVEILKDFGPERSDNVPTCITFSPNGNFLAVGTKLKRIHIYYVESKDWQKNELTLTDTEKARPEIQQQVFSSDSKHLAVIDSEYSTSLFAYDFSGFDSKGQKEWTYVGKLRVHHAPIRSVSFGETMEENGTKTFKLFTVSEDMTMAQYRVLEIDYNQKIDPNILIKRLELESHFQIEQECFPSACIWYPLNMYKENTLLTVNEDYKIKLWNFLKKDNVICQRTCLGPTYAGAINRLLVLNPNDQQNEYQDKYLAYSTKDKVVGIIKLPLEGNPNQTMGLIAHPEKITGISSTQDGKLFFTSGSDDYAVNIWSVNFQALEEAFQTNPKEDPFPALLEGGEDGPTHEALKNFFYYSQIRSKDEHTTKARRLDGKVPLRAISDMIRSMGHYPTLKEIENMQNEIKFSKYLSTGEYIEELDLDMFLKLFVNHRPVYGIGRQAIQEALQTLVQTKQNDNDHNEGNDGNGERFELTREELLKILQNEGERMTPQEIKEAFETLLGEGERLPDIINPDNLTHDILAFEDMESGVRDEENDEMEEMEEGDEEDV